MLFDRAAGVGIIGGPKLANGGARLIPESLNPYQRAPPSYFTDARTGGEMSKIFSVSEAKTESLALVAIRDCYRDVANQSIGDWARYAGSCESEIEKLFLAGLIGAAIVEMPQRTMIIRPHNGQSLDLNIPKCAPSASYAVLAIQPKIGNYRVDFALGCHDCGIPVMVAIECDGHDFHERTKEQAERDRSRDRYLTGDGFLVLRFTGREIWRDARGCAAQVLKIIDDELERQESVRWEARL